ncbi:hypothetical protein Lbir_1831 [Legionella birminghamensis]|uniref:Transmembrane protein n=1 Tax=Legionella birminghamensis TaxID=28083 RepID=A0A378IDI1_9GAMM|nr:DUF4381 domain-containing protein [Legionella birminghamensis]KTC70248.1 hypothetical protein Lbir_1831 [Legionella birminghamensis]STX30344.1 Uncharacterised protein [Legionella birminghamensis]
MTEPNALNNLRDIHLPEAIGWWPLAPGWYLLILVILCIFILGLYYFFEYQKNSKPKRHALKLLAQYQEEYQRTGNSQLASTRISELLKRVALVYFSRETVASLKGDDWVAFLNQTGKKINFNAVRQQLLELPYQSSTSQVNLAPLFTRARLWIKQRGKRCLN